MTYSYRVLYLKELTSELSQITNIFEQYNAGDYLKKIYKVYSRTSSRAVVCYKDKLLIGIYMYTNGKFYFSNINTIQYKHSVLLKHKIDPAECTIPILAVVDKNNYEESIYYEMNKLRVIDAKNLGYKYGIININADMNNLAFCKMLEWSTKPEFFSKLTDTTIISSGFYNTEGNPILIQKY